MENAGFKISLRAARVNAGLTQEEASERAGCARSTLNGYESGKTQPTYKTLKAMCELYGIQMEMLKE